MASRSIVVRVLIALGLMVGFYALALAIVALLFLVPYFEITFLHRIYVKLTVGCVVAGLAILASLVPRPRKFVEPGPRLTADEHPRLFAEIEGVASATAQSMPTEVFLVSEVNAWVAERGGFLGIGSRRVMGVGLPLMQVLTVPQFRAVLAHEFGHYYGGDTRLGVFVYHIRAAIGRTIESMGGSALNGLFVSYGNLFLRVTHSVSRAQEMSADLLAARVIGPHELAGGLVAVHRAAVSFPAFWNSEVVPVLRAERRVPVLDGFTRFLASPEVQQEVQAFLTASEPNAYDTHPPLTERLDALGGAPPDGDGPLAITLFGDRSTLEQRYLDITVGSQTRTYETVAWEEVGDAVYLPAYRRVIGVQREALANVRPVDLPRIATDATEFASRLLVPQDQDSPADRARIAAYVLGAALAIVLADCGFRVVSLPGYQVELVRTSEGDERVRPFSVVFELASGEIPAASWSERCRSWGIAGTDLGALGTRPTTPSTLECEPEPSPRR